MSRLSDLLREHRDKMQRELVQATQKKERLARELQEATDLIQQLASDLNELTEEIERRDIHDAKQADVRIREEPDWPQ
jgi:uncharacterized protein involved in exopolysaccharide biosynthesis